jgi:hypothetical protein
MASMTSSSLAEPIGGAPGRPGFLTLIVQSAHLRHSVRTGRICRGTLRDDAHGRTIAKQTLEAAGGS